MPTVKRSICVVKLGGSLFDLPDLNMRLEQLLRPETTEQELWLVPGGGRFADEIRRLDRIHGWPVELAHRIAIQSMGLSARLITAMAPNFQLVQQLNANPGGNCFVLDVSQLPELNELPAGWDLTSDSIAAWVGKKLEAAQLMLLKSTSLESPLPDVVAASRTDRVDACFPDFAKELPEISWVNLRSAAPKRQTWLRWGTVAHPASVEQIDR